MVNTIAVADTPDEAPGDATSAYAWYVLGVFFLVYCLNFIDRQILSILAEDVKRDLGLKDEDLGFLFGTAFGVFHAVFGIPIGRLADQWHRIRLLTLGIGLWSAATAMCGLAQSSGTLAAARMGVGVGEATAGPAAFSMLSDWFPPRLRATALAIYSSGLYLGVGLSLGIGGLLVKSWNEAYPQGGPLGLAAWQAAFLLVGLLGLPLAALVATLREPPRGISEGITSKQSQTPFRDFLGELCTIVPPFTIYSAARLGVRTLMINLSFAVAIAICVLLSHLAGEPLQQWTAVGVGTYSVFSWSLVLKKRDPVAFGLVIASPAMISTIVAYALIAGVTYTLGFWAAPYAIRELAVDTSSVGFLVGGTLAVAGLLGVIAGGAAADKLKQRYEHGRLLMVAFGTIAPIPFAALAFTTHLLPLFVVGIFCAVASATSALGGAAATTQDLVLPRMRGTATAAFFVGGTMLGLALGPYVAGRVSTLTESLSTGVLSTLAMLPIALGAAVIAIRTVPRARAERDGRARSLGEPLFRKRCRTIIDRF